MKTSFKSKSLSSVTMRILLSQSTPQPLVKKTRAILKTIPALVVAFSFAATDAHAITRSCSAKLYITKSGDNGFPESFSANGNCGGAVPNRCRERAKDAANKCAGVHWDTRWERKRPEHCQPGAKVHDYGLNDLKQWIENRACEKGWKKGTVKLILRTYGQTAHCSSTREIGSYDMLPSFCGD